MAGIYIHIPFCRKACHYCNFHFSTSLQYKADFIYALIKEAEMVAQDAGLFKDDVIETIYFGGGTPSLLSPAELQAILHAISQQFKVQHQAEITLEANPDDISSLQLREWKSAGINRLSIGVQSFFDEDLRWMNRAHNGTQALHSIEAVIQEGFSNFTVDLIYGTPLLTDDKWKKNVQTVVRLGVPHLSCYALTVEPSTALHKMIKQKKISDIDPDQQATQFLHVTDWLAAAGYEHYEVSNFAKPGMRSRHNSAYWQGKHYLGFGPSAHSFNGSSRRWNIANNALYIQSIHNGLLPAETEYLTPLQQLNEYIMISLRTIEGLDLQRVTDTFGKEKATHIQHEAQKYIHDGRIKATGNALQLTRRGKLFADGIAADFFEL